MSANQQSLGKMSETLPIAAAEAKKAPGESAQKAAKRKKHAEHKDAFRETLETVVFVVFLVLLLKAFVAEAFVIPTGSMATTLLGDHCHVTCERCGWKYTVNAQDNNRIKERVEAICPNCRHEVVIAPVNADGGDKVLVFKTRYDLARPDRHDVIVFKFPGQPKYLSEFHRPGDGDERMGGPQKDYIAFNYIKRLWGLPGDRLAIWYGDVHLRVGNGADEELQIIRRSPDKYAAMRRIVNHNDFQDPNNPLPPRWADEGQPPGWQAVDNGKTFEFNREQRAWLSYRNYLRPERAAGKERSLQTNQKRVEELDNALARRAIAPGQEAEARQEIDRLRADIKQDREQLDREYKEAARAQLITDFLGYNSAYSYNWTPDLMIEFEVDVRELQGELIVELVGGVDRHRARFNLEDGACTLQTLREGKPLAYVDEKGQELPADIARAGTKIGRKGKHDVRFCSFDQRLTLWVDGKLVFGDGIIFPAPSDAERGPRLADLRPARIGASNASVKVAKLQLYRDIYYTRETRADVEPGGGVDQLGVSAAEERELVDHELARLTPEQRQLSPEEQRTLIEHRARPEKWASYYYGQVGKIQGSMRPPKQYPIVDAVYHPSEELGPDEYFALGDNSTQSSDSRAWGQVPERLLLGRAVSVYWPLPSRFGLIR